jgi:hypothetical protein
LGIFGLVLKRLKIVRLDLVLLVKVMAVPGLWVFLHVFNVARGV